MNKQRVKQVLIIYIAWKVLIYAIAYSAQFIIPLYSNYIASWDFGLRLPYLVWVWGNFDGMHYMEIARNGYHVYQTPFFPVFPMLIRLLTRLFHIPFIISGQIISNIAFIGSLLLFYPIMQKDKRTELYKLIILIILLFPTAFFFQAVYNDAIFLFLSTLTIYFSRNQKWVFASIAAAIATLTRLNGLALTILVLIEYCTYMQEYPETWKLSILKSNTEKLLSFKSALESKIYAISIIPATFIGYLVYIQFTRGTWTAIFSSMKIWNQNRVTFPLQVLWRYIKIIASAPLNQSYLIASLEFLFVCFYIFLISYSFKKIRLSYWFFLIVSFLIPSLTGTFQGMPRYGLHLYPLFLTIAILLKNKSRKVRIVYFIISITLLVLYISLFTRGYFVS